MLHWLLHTDAGLVTRIAIGVTIFAILGLADLAKHGQAATRWREYGVLLVAVAAAIVYGALNDQVTSSISWEYFFYGKELNHVLGPAVPPDLVRLHVEAAKVGAKATWTVGLLCGVVLLIANNPRRGWPRLRNRELVRFIPIIFAMAALFGAAGGWLGSHGALTQLEPDFQDLWRSGIWRPKRFMCTWGMHLGGYVGGIVGTFVSATCVVWSRSRLRAADPATEVAGPLG